MTALLPERQFSEAKAGLSEVMNEVVHEHRTQLVRRHSKEEMVLVRREDAQRWLDTFRLDLQVTLDPGQVAVLAGPLGVIGIGSSFDAALDALVDEIQEYAAQFFGRIEYYLHTDAIRHEPYLLRFAFAPPSEHRALLDADIKAGMPKGSGAVASAV